MTTYPAEKVFKNFFSQDLEFLFLKEDIISIKSSSKNKTTVEVINILLNLLNQLKI